MSSRSRPMSGQALVEFALVAPIFFVLMFAVIEGGRFIFYYEMLNNATREGARYAIVHGGNSQIGPRSGPGPGADPCASSVTDDCTGANVIDAAKNAAIGLVSSGSLSADPPAWWDCMDPPPAPGDESTGTNERGKCVTVFLNYTYQTIIPVLPPITISAESSLVINN